MGVGGGDLVGGLGWMLVGAEVLIAGLHDDVMHSQRRPLVVSRTITIVRRTMTSLDINAITPHPLVCNTHAVVPPHGR